MPDAVMPRAVLMATKWLQAQAAVTALVGQRISYRLGGTYPAIRITDIGTIDRGPEEELRRLQIECYADDYDDAERIAATVVSVLPEARGQWADGYCAGAAVESGPFHNPDPDPERHRHQLDIAFALYPVPS